MHLNIYQRDVTKGMQRCLFDVISKSCRETECSRLLGWLSILLPVKASTTTRGGWLTIEPVVDQVCERTRLHGNKSQHALASCPALSWQEGYYVERVTAILQDPRRYEVYWENARDKWRVEIGVQIIVAKDTMSARVKLATEIVKSSSNVVVYGTVSHVLTRYRVI